MTFVKQAAVKIDAKRYSMARQAFHKRLYNLIRERRLGSLQDTFRPSCFSFFSQPSREREKAPSSL